MRKRLESMESKVETYKENSLAEIRQMHLTFDLVKESMHQRASAITQYNERINAIADKADQCAQQIDSFQQKITKEVN